MCSGPHQFAPTNQGHRSWQAVRQWVGASGPGKCLQEAARPKIANRSSWNGATLSWRSSSVNETNVVLDGVQRSLDTRISCGAGAFTLPGPLSIVARPIVCSYAKL